MKRLFFLLLVLIGITSTSYAASINYKLTVSNISNVNFETTYTTHLTYSINGADSGLLLPDSDFTFLRYSDSNNYVQSVTASGTMFTIKFKRRDTSARINGTLTLVINARKTDDSTSVGLYNLNLNYTYNALTKVDGGKIDGPDKNHEVGESPSVIVSIYDAIPLTGTTITYSWEKSNDKTNWTELANSNYNNRLPDAIGYTSDFYRRKATDSAGNSGYSNIVEILPMFNAGEIGISYTDSSSIITLTNIKAPNSSGATISWQSSTNLDEWTNIGGTSTTKTVTKPTTTTYYRRKVTSSAVDEDDEPVVCYSNIVCYSTSSPVYVQTQTYYTSSNTVNDNAYYDGLGRPVQQVSVGAAPSGNDIIATTAYDNKGREFKKLLPFSYDNDGAFAHNAAYKSNTFHNDDYASTVTTFDNSPLDRTVRSYKPGEVYQSDDAQHYVEHNYSLNVANEVKRILVNSAGDILVSDNYTAESLYKYTITDEDGTQITTFTDSEGKTILERRLVATNSYADTYYVYDVKNRLRWVITPKGSDLLTNGTTYSITDTLAKDHCYIYQYDNEDRITERRLPGCESSYYSYDSYGRLITYRDGKLNNLGIHQNYSYDALNRISRVSYPSNSSTEENVQHISHYDDYNALPSTLAYNVVSGVVSSTDKLSSIKGKLAYEQIYEVYDAESTATPQVLTRVYYYDKRDRVIQTVTQYPDGILCRTSVKYDYAGNPLITLEKYTYNNKSLTIRTERTFDKRSRQLTEQTIIDDRVVSNAEFVYDELGRMQRLELNDKVSINTSYNLQGWISSIDCNTSSSLGNGLVLSEDVFNEQLSYYDPADDNSTPRYSGKISEQRWTHGSAMNGYKGFAYAYDNFGRLTDAQMFTSSQNNAIANDIREQISYDKNSNVIRLSDTRGLSTTTRNYAVQGNQVVQMIANGNNMGYPTYDERGNMTQNVEAGLQMSYNLCNLPKQITTVNGKTVKYTYFADGTKFKAVDAAGKGFAYTGSLRWGVQDGILTPENIAITGGRAVYSDNNWAANYYIADHLGSVRAVTDTEGEVLDTFDYMPYGSEISSTSSTTTDYRFTGKERQSMVNNSIYDSFARFQNTYSRFMSIDPKAESFYHISPYTYCAGDPVNLVDPDGNIPIIPILWAAYEIGSAIYDVYTAYDTLTDKDASTYDKVTACGGALLSAVAPGGGYTLFSKADDVARIANTADKVSDGAKAANNVAKVKKPYSNNRPSYAKGQVEEVWERAKDKDGIVRDPYTGEVLTWDKSKPRTWDMGHIEGEEYRKMHKRYMDGEISKDDFLKWFRNPDNYQPQSQYSNRSHKFEQH